ncbi:hypothetical protein BB561_004155 [Smittium simulii]|uniref:Uncharacterized protein n=1 Tax=Smittium simulii TaxID=133385 RepID=A0A2T9YHT7_9FUNG|nr:hypothetical protein BB561_004155 [Smittium simulii]
MSNVPGAIPSNAAGVPLIPTKRTRLEYSTVAKTAFNPQEFTEVSIIHLLDNSISKALKKACYGGSNTKTGCSWTQFSGNINAAIDYVALKIDNEYVSYQHDSRAKATYFIFYNEERAEKCMNTPIYYNGIAVELYQTVTLEEGTQIITIPNTNSLNIIKLVEAVNNSFGKNGITMTHDMHYNDSLEPLIDDILEWLNCKLGAHCRKVVMKKIRKSSKNKILTKKIATLILNSIVFTKNTFIGKDELTATKRIHLCESKKNLTKIGSGLLIAVQNRSSWSISELRNKYSWMSVKINSKTASGKENEIIVINIHTPHLATEKKIMKKQIE